jgi:Ca2+-binding RTX toxin-like protein
MTATMYGYAGADDMAGSRDDSNYSETLRGGDNDDFIEGQPGDDICVGEAGADTIDGGLGNDALGGGIGADWLKGNNGNDLLCGGGDVDVLDGDDNNDILVGGGQTGDDADGGAGTDECGGSTIYAFCETIPPTSLFTCPL